MEQPANPEESTPAEENKEPSVATEHPATQVTSPAAAPATVVENVDLGKIGSILNSLSSVIKHSGEPVLVAILAEFIRCNKKEIKSLK